MTNLSVWLTPIWLLAVGATAGTLFLLLLWGICAIANRRLARSIWVRVKEGILLPISYTLLALAVIAVVATPMMPLDRMISSLKRMPQVGPVSFEVTVPANTSDFEVSDLAFNKDELVRYSIESERDIALNIEPGKGFTKPLILVEGGPLYQWSPGSNLPRAFEENVTRLFVSNESDLPTVVKGTFLTEVEMPEVHDLVVSASSVVALYLIYLLICGLAPRVSIIATATAKEAVSQPLFLLLTIVGVVALVAYLHSLQHVWRRRENAQNVGHDDHQSARHYGRPLDCQRLGFRRN